MSDTEDGSDGADDDASGTDEDPNGTDDFDKEAEREKLREQYERDQKRREATQHMSDLLLKGATMTNAHCDECGSPIFRYDGEAFCPTCAGTREVPDAEGGGGEPAESGGQAAGAGGQTAGASGERAEGAAGPGSADVDGPGDDGREGRPGTSQTDPSSAHRVASPGAATGGDDEVAGATAPTGDDEEMDLEAARRRLDERAPSRSPAGGATDRQADTPRTAGSPVRQGEVPSMAQSRASLRRAIVSLSEQAAQSDDPGRAHNLLKGAREAAEALAALEGTTGE
jgi:hypothetical protein